MRVLLEGSNSASRSGCRARIRLNNPSSVGEGLVWVTASFRLQVRLLPPRFREIPAQRGGLRPFYPIPARDPLFPDVKQRNSVETGHQGTVEGANGGDESVLSARIEQGCDHGVDGGVFSAHIVARARDIRRSTAPIEPLFVARRQRLIQAVWNHVELVGEAALVVLNGIDRTYRGLDARALQTAGKVQRDPLLVAARYQDFEAQRDFGRTLTQHRAVEIVAGLGQQCQRATQRRPIAARAVGHGQTIAAIENVGCNMRGEWSQELALAIVGGTAISRQLRPGEVAARARIEAEEVIAVDPFEMKQQRQRLAHANIGEYRAPGIEHQILRLLR